MINFGYIGRYVRLVETATIAPKPASERVFSFLEPFQMPQPDLISEEIKEIVLLRLIDAEYNLTGSWIGNGCEHGFKPARDCPNENCGDAVMQRLWDDVFAVQETRCAT